MGSPRGSISIFRDVFQEEKNTQSQPKKGRSKELIDKRNICLTHRYWYYGNFPLELKNKADCKLSYYSILNILQEEFFINSEFTIPQVINECSYILSDLKEKKPSKDYFKKRWPHLVW